MSRRLAGCVALMLATPLGACGGAPAPRAINRCPSLPQGPAGMVVEIDRHNGESLTSFAIQLADGACPRDAWRRALYPDEDLQCLDVGADGIAAALAALQRAGVTRWRETESRAEDVSPHRGGWSVTATWPGGSCAVADSWVWRLEPSDADRFEALRAELGKLRGSKRLSRTRGSRTVRSSSIGCTLRLPTIDALTGPFGEGRPKCEPASEPPHEACRQEGRRPTKLEFGVLGIENCPAEQATAKHVVKAGDGQKAQPCQRDEAR